ncbi:DUF2344 domain-containing protein [bacterium]|nr:DUF2344 domain-containing protein [bacterium]
MYRRIHYINDQLKPLRIKVNWHDPKKSVLESAFARGDARLGQVLLTAWKLGARFDEWQEGFDYSIWEEAFTRHGFTLPEYAAKSYEGTDIFPWQAISILVESRYLWKEWEKTFQEKTTAHCGYEQCRACRVCDGERTQTINIDKNGNHFALYREQNNAEIAPKANQKSPTGQPFRYRIRFQKLGPLKYASHRDFMGIFESTLRRAGIKMAYSEGFNPRPRIVYASALSTGMESYGEYLDIATKQEYQQEEVEELLVNHTQEGFEIVHVEKLPPNAKKISSLVKAFAFEVLFRHAGDLEEAGNVIRDVISQPNIQSELNLIHYWLESLTKGYVKMGYLCALNHGKFTKAREISEKIREKSHIMLDIDKVLRLDMLKLNQQNEYVPIIPIHSALEKRELCNAKS